jgi:PAS domain S-box-containing protein
VSTVEGLSPQDDRDVREDRYERLVELAADALIVHDGDVIIDVNHAALRLAGATDRADLVGQPISRVLRPPYLRSVETQLTNETEAYELAPPVLDIFHRLDGTTVGVDVRAQVFLVDGVPCAHLIVRDITDRVEAEAKAHEAAVQLLAAQRIDAVGTLAGGVAHEVNNMMQVVLGFGALLLDERDQSHADFSHLTEIMRAASHAADITRQLLEFSRHARHQPRATQLGPALRELEPMLRRVVGESRTFTLTVGEALNVYMDVGQLEQVLVNLLVNARHATTDAGAISVLAERRVVDSLVLAVDGAGIPYGPYIAMSVRDDGAGMSAAVRGQMFDPFFTTKPEGIGTGLGLSAVQGIVAQHSGVITVASLEGHGTTITVYWPEHTLVDSTVRPALATTPSIPRIAVGKTILVIDDEPAVRAVSRRMLERSGYAVREASGGVDALESLRAHGAPDLLLTDLMMPGMGGSELARRVHERWASVPILFMSGHALSSNSKLGTEGQNVQYIQKPFSIVDILAQIDRMLSVPQGDN